MTESNANDAEEAVVNPKQGPGERLQAARIEMGLTVEDIANRMHLSSAILESIENNNFDDITAPIFVKGYLRAYSRIVSLPEEDLINQYVNFYSNEDPPISSTSNTVPEISTDDARIKWTTYLVVAVLVALLSVWWWNKHQNPSDVVSLDANEPTIVAEVNEQQSDTNSSESAVVVAIEADSESTENTDSIENQTTDEVVNKEESEDSNVNTGSSSENAEVVDTEVDSGDQSGDSTADSQPLSNESEMLSENSNNQNEVDDEVSDASRIIRQAPSGDDHLVLTVNADTWADIKDKNDHRLVYDLLRANESIELVGASPFKLFFGNGHGVELEFNRNPVDISSDIRDDNTARLSVGN